MKQITKKEFKSKYAKKEFELVASCFDKSKEDMSKVLNKMDVESIKTIDLSRSDIGSDEAVDTKVYIDSIKGKLFYFVESIIDYSKVVECSWDNLQTNCIIYIGV